jgi:hypothetical protein
MRSQAQSCVCLKAEKQKQKALDNQGLSMFLERGILIIRGKPHEH